MAFTHRNGVIPFHCLLLLLSCLVGMSQVPSSVSKGTSCSVPDIKGEAFTLFLLRKLLAMILPCVPSQAEKVQVPFRDSLAHLIS